MVINTTQIFILKMETVRNICIHNILNYYFFPKGFLSSDWSILNFFAKPRDQGSKPYLENVSRLK